MDYADKYNYSEWILLQSPKYYININMTHSEIVRIIKPSNVAYGR